MTMNRSSSAHHILSRRRFLQVAGAGTALLSLSACTAQGVRLVTPPSSKPGADSAAATTVASSDELVELRLTARPGEEQILPGQPTRVFMFAGEVIQGDPGMVTTIPGAYVGPILRLQRGQKVRLHVRNELDQPTTAHLHGLLVPEIADGQPAYPVAPGEETVYDFEVINRPGTYWLHPHPHQLTAEQVYQGMAGLVIVSDPAEAALGLPAGELDLPLILQDRRFDTANQFAYAGSGMNAMMDRMMGLLGDRFLVNGQVDARIPVSTQPYRLRVLNGSNARIYKLAWDNGEPLTVIGTDGGLLTQPITRPYVMLAPGERVELWADFGADTVGSERKLVSLAFADSEMMAGMGQGNGMGGMGMMRRAGVAQGAPFEIMTFAVESAATGAATLPQTLLPVDKLAESSAVNADNPRRWVFAMGPRMQWTINGRVYEMDEVAADERVTYGDTEVWEFVNAMHAPGMGMGGMGNGGMGNGGMGNGGMGNGMGGMMDFMGHPVHVHGVQFQVLDRQVDSAQQRGWDSVKEGYVDEGWKDTLLIMPGERARVIMRFNDYRGRYLIHCHNLEHEDAGMMRNFQIS